MGGKGELSKGGEAGRNGKAGGGKAGREKEGSEGRGGWWRGTKSLNFA